MNENSNTTIHLKINLMFLQKIANIRPNHVSYYKKKVLIMKLEHETITAPRPRLKSQTRQSDVKLSPVFTQFSTRYDSETSAIWCWMQPEPRPCLNARLIDEVVLLQHKLTKTYKSQHPDTIWPFRHLILASKTP